MQKRFCTCGYLVLVRYENSRGKWHCRLINGRKAARKISGVTVCPACGCVLNINTLR
jgi:hypothetical protein